MTLKLADWRVWLWQLDAERCLRVGVSVPHPNAAAWEAVS